MRVAQKRQAGGIGKCGRYQEIAVACNPEYRYAGVCHRTDGIDYVPVKWRFDIVVTRPIFENIAEQIEIAGMPRAVCEEVKKRLGSARQRRLQMQIRNEKRNRIGN